MTKHHARVLVDFDGVIRQHGRDAGEMPGARKALRELKRQGKEVLVFTARATSEQGKAYVEQWMRNRGLHHDGVTAIKLNAEHYIDDKASTFTNWDDVLANGPPRRRIRSFEEAADAAKQALDGGEPLKQWVMGEKK